MNRDLFEEDHEAFRDSVRKFVATEVAPYLDEWRIAGRVPQDLFLAIGAEGMLGTAAPENLGGGGTDDLRFTAVLVEELAAIGATGLALTMAVHAGVCLTLILDHASTAQQKAWGPGLISGERVGTTAAIGAPVALATAADDNELDLTLAGVSGGRYAGLVALAIGTDDVLIIPTDEWVVSTDAVEDALAARDAGQADISLTGTVSADSVLARAVGDVRRDLDLWIAVLAVASARRALELTVDYVQVRKVFGRPLAELENTRHRLATVAAGLASAQLYVDTALRRRTARQLTPADAATARLVGQATLDDAVDQGMQLHGGYGYMREYPISHAFADARFLRIVGRGSSEALDVVAADLGI